MAENVHNCDVLIGAAKGKRKKERKCANSATTKVGQFHLCTVHLKRWEDGQPLKVKPNLTIKKPSA